VAEAEPEKFSARRLQSFAKRAVESNEIRAVMERGPGRVVLGSKPQLATAKELVSWPERGTAKKALRQQLMSVEPFEGGLGAGELLDVAYFLERLPADVEQGGGGVAFAAGEGDFGQHA